MKHKLYSLLGLLFAASFSANAALIKIESVDIAQNFNQTDLQAYWNSKTPTSSLKVTDLSGLFFNGSKYNDTLYKLTANFSSANPLEVSFLAGLDAGRGAELFVNNVLTVDKSSNIWWQRNWNSAHVIGVENILFESGPNTIELYWSENGNSGGNSFKLVETELSAVNASAPSVAILLGLGFAGLALRRRKH
jgi:hypothetical protein